MPVTEAQWRRPSSWRIVAPTLMPSQGYTTTLAACVSRDVPRQPSFHTKLSCRLHLAQDNSTPLAVARAALARLVADEATETGKVSARTLQRVGFAETLVERLEARGAKATWREALGASSSSSSSSSSGTATGTSSSNSGTSTSSSTASGAVRTSRPFKATDGRVFKTASG